jgi:hypothetical protein
MRKPSTNLPTYTHTHTHTQTRTTDWKLIKTEDGYSVYRKFLGVGPSSQYACVMCNGVINAPAKDVLSLFEDNTRYRVYMCRVCVCYKEYVCNSACVDCVCECQSVCVCVCSVEVLSGLSFAIAPSGSMPLSLTSTMSPQQLTFLCLYFFLLIYHLMQDRGV